MSQVLDEADQKLAPTEKPVPSKLAMASGLSVMIWAGAASMLLVGSGVVRAVQSSQYTADKNSLVECPFPLSKIPQTIEGWHVLKGSDQVLDPLTTRITGSTDHIIRTYYDDGTGVMLSVLVLFGPAEPVIPHTPQICYPSSGFQTVGETIDVDVKISDSEDAKFRSSVFAKAGGRSVIRQTVYHSFLLDGVWSPTIPNRRFARKNPGIFKVQIQRRVVDGEKRDADEPIEDFVKKLIPTLEQMIETSGSSKTQPASS